MAEVFPLHPDVPFIDLNRGRATWGGCGAAYSRLLTHVRFYSLGDPEVLRSCSAAFPLPLPLPLRSDPLRSVQTCLLRPCYALAPLLAPISPLRFRSAAPPPWAWVRGDPWDYVRVSDRFMLGEICPIHRSPSLKIITVEGFRFRKVNCSIIEYR